MAAQRTAISLFSGCGGDTLGLERAGYKVIAFSEFMPCAIASHHANFPDSVHLVGGLVTKSPSGDDSVAVKPAAGGAGMAEPKMAEPKMAAKPKAKGRKAAADPTSIVNIEDSVFAAYRDKVDVIFAGFPCQGFSKAGKKDAADPRNQMFRHFVRAAAAIQPRFIIGENVVGLTSMRSGPAETDPLMLDLIRAAFREAGYELTHKILEATDFGVPQKRKRIVLVGWRVGAVGAFNADAFWAAVAAAGAGHTMPTMRSFVTDSLEGAMLLPPAAVDGRPVIPEDFAEYALPIPETAEPTGEPHPYLALKVGAGLLSCSKRVSPIHSEIVDMDAPSKTIICTYDHQPRLYVGLLKPSGAAYARCLLPDELKQIQGFPADYIIEGNWKDKVVQIGNAVPPPMIECVALALTASLPSALPVSSPFEAIAAPKPKARRPKIKFIADD